MKSQNASTQSDSSIKGSSASLFPTVLKLAVRGSLKTKPILFTIALFIAINIGVPAMANSYEREAINLISLYSGQQYVAVSDKPLPNSLKIQVSSLTIDTRTVLLISTDNFDEFLTVNGAWLLGNPPIENEIVVGEDLRALVNNGVLLINGQTLKVTGYLQSYAVSHLTHSIVATKQTFPNQQTYYVGTSGHHGAFSSHPQWTSTAKSGTALQFDGVDDCAYVAHKTAFVTAPFSASVWFRASQLPSDKGEDEVVVSKTCTANPWISWRTCLQAGAGGWRNRIRFDVVDKGKGWHTVVSDSAISINTWYHVVCTLASNYDMRMYVNNVLQTSTANLGSTYTATPGSLNLGAQWSGGERLVGIIDEIAFFSRVITSGEIFTLYNLSGRVESGLTGEWHFDENGGDTAHDTSSGNMMLDETVVSAPAAVQTARSVFSEILTIMSLVRYTLYGALGLCCFFQGYNSLIESEQILQALASIGAPRKMVNLSMLGYALIVSLTGTLLGFVLGTFLPGLTSSIVSIVFKLPHLKPLMNVQVGLDLMLGFSASLLALSIGLLGGYSRQIAAA